jgi:LysM repeat protein
MSWSVAPARNLGLAMTFALAALASGQARAQPAGLLERSIPPSSPPVVIRESPRPAPAASPARSSPATTPVARAQGYVPYTVRPGDSLSALAARFAVPIEELARANNLAVDAMLIEGASLRVPNQFEAQSSGLRAQVDQLGAQLAQAEARARDAEARLRAVTGQSEQAAAELLHLRRDVNLLAWWRGAALGLAAAALLMFGVMAVTLFEWWRLRRRFVALAGLTESLSRLDQKYKAMLAKAELRLQQLYGRRRQGMTEGQPRPKLPEEIEIERLNEELKDVLNQHLERLGARSRKRGRLRARDLVGDVDSPVAARTVRR